MVETPQIYYNTQQITHDHTTFIVGLIHEIYRGTAHQRPRRRQLLTYIPNDETPLAAYPVFTAKLTVLTYSDWQQANHFDQLPEAGPWFAAYPTIDQLLAFRTYIPNRGTAKLTWHFLPDTTFLPLIMKAQRALDRDFSAFAAHRRTRLALVQPPLKALGYF